MLEALLQYRIYMAVRKRIEDYLSLPAKAYKVRVLEYLKLVGHRRRAHSNYRGDVPHA